MCSLDGAAEVECVLPVSYSGLSGGSHVFVVRAVDAAGNRDESGASFAFEIRLPVETTLISAHPTEELTRDTSAAFTFAADQSTASFECSLDGASFSACSSGISYAGLADGIHTFRVRAVDPWGEPDASPASHSWTVDTTPPEVQNFSISATTNSITVSWVTNEPATTHLLFGVGSLLNQQVPETATYQTTHTLKLVGLTSNTTYSVLAQGHDRAGNPYTFVVRTIRTGR
ncbi:MAG: hypothetical protein HC902_13635 [Calothrix sp. SM1_5_4]|nr:hypothetical protein [Calothrix sp. SM1_5_4]